MYLSIHVCMYVYVCMYACVYECMYEDLRYRYPELTSAAKIVRSPLFEICISNVKHTIIRACMYSMYVYVCMYVCMYVCTVCMYVLVEEELLEIVGK